MKSNSCSVQRWVFALAGFVVFNAAAQKEQWLEYHTGSELRGYRWVELSTNPPANVAMPKLRAYVLYGEWKNGLDGSRWLCLDGRSRSAGCDQVFFDSNGNGRLDDEKPLSRSQGDGGSVVMFPPLKMVFKGEDGPTAYHLNVRLYGMEGDRAQLLTSAGGWYEGMVDFAGKKRKVQLYDYTVNGAFNDGGLGSSQCDQLAIGGDAPVTRYLGKHLELDGQLFRIDVARDGAFIKVEKAQNVKTATVRVPETISEFEAVGENGHFVRKPVKGELALPSGKYRVHSWTIKRKDDQGVNWSLSGSGFSQAADFEAGSTGSALLQVGEPIRPVLDATESKTQVEFGLRLLGPLDETVNIMRGEDRPRAPQLNIASIKGTFKTTSTFEYG